MGPSKWPQQAIFILLDKQCIWEELAGQRNLGGVCLISEESKQSLDLG